MKAIIKIFKILIIIIGIVPFILFMIILSLFNQNKSEVKKIHAEIKRREGDRRLLTDLRTHLLKL